MAPKPAKKGAGPAVNKDWEAGLVTAQFEQESWQACLSFVVGGSPEDEELVQALALAVLKPQRKLFSLLSWDSIIAKIHELGNPKAKKPEGVPAFYEVTEPAKVLLDAGEEIPCDLIAKIVKFQLLHIKVDDLQRRETENAKMENPKASSPPAKDNVGAKATEKKGKSLSSPDLTSKDKKTKLKRRGDVDPPQFIDDEPDDGPQHYILMLGFYEPHLIAALDAIGVQVASVIKLGSEHAQSCERQHGEHTWEGEEQILRASPDLEETSHGGVELATQAFKFDLFWSGLRRVLDSRAPESKLNDVVQLNYTVPNLILPVRTQDPESELEIGSQIFQGVASLIYDCLDWRRQYQHYLDNIKLISVPSVVGLDLEPAEVVSSALPIAPRSKKKPLREESSKDKEKEQRPLSTDVDMRYYDNLLNLVPPEACSVPLILHCMLEQVVISTDQSTLSLASEPKPHQTPGLDPQMVSLKLQSFLPLLSTKEEKKLLLNIFLTTSQNEEEQKKLLKLFGEEETQTQKKSRHPQVIKHLDERALRLRDFTVAQGFDPAEVESSMMRLSPIWELIQSVAQQRNSSPCWMAIKQQLQHYCTDDVVSWSEVEHLIHQSVFESMPLTTVDENGVLFREARPVGSLEPAQHQTPIIIPWDNPLSFARQKLNNLQSKDPAFLTENPANSEVSERVFGQLELSDVQRCRLRSLFDCYYTEHHDASVLPQVIQLASEDYCCLDTFRGSLKNILYIFCHNPMSSYHQCKEFWDITLHTDVKFRKYVEHVADTITDWTKEEELKREEMKHRILSRAESLKDEEMIDPEEKEKDTLEPVIRKDSLKAWKLEQEQLKEEDMAKKSKKDNASKGKQQKEEAKSANNKSKPLSSSKKSRAGTANSSAKTPRESVPNTAPPAVEKQHPKEEPLNGFIGYSMDGKLIHLSGCLQQLFPSDGGQITVEKVSYVEGSSLMKVVVKKDGHRFCTHINQVAVAAVKPATQSQETDVQRDVKESVDVEKKRVKQGSLSAVLDNGIHLSYSFYGPTGEYIVHAEETARGAPETSNVIPIPLTSFIHLQKETVVDSAHSKIHRPNSDTRSPESQKVGNGQTTATSVPFNSLSLSVPNGLLLQFLREDTQEKQGMLVKQTFPLHGSGEAAQIQDPSLSKEVSRIITSQGAVIRCMRDGSTEVLFADGSVSLSKDSGPVWVTDSEVEEEKNSEHTEDENKEMQADNQRGYWLTTTPSGHLIHTVGTTHKHLQTTPLLSFKATDPVTNEVMLSREDLVVSVQNPDGSFSVEHADGTRITSVHQNLLPNMTQQLLPVFIGSASVDHPVGQPESGNLKSPSECNEEEVSRVRDKQDADHEHVNEEQEGSVNKNIESFLAEKNGNRSACESDKGSLSGKEHVLLVEKEGCATVMMFPEQHTAHVFFADGTVITGNSQGAYQVFPSSVGLLQVQNDGNYIYSSGTFARPSPYTVTPTKQSGSYTMSHRHKVACNITDPDGNHFQVMEDGQVSVLNLSPAPSTLKQDGESEQDKEERRNERIYVKRKQRGPRLFMVHEDGSGTELLSSQTAEELLYQAYSDPVIAVLKEPLPDKQDEFSNTILKPSHQNIWSQWLLGKQNPEITPPNLKNRTWHDLPRTETNSSGPPFGTDMEGGLTMRKKSGSADQHRPVLSCPKVLEMRQLFQHRPFTTPLKNTLDARLKEFIEILMEREQQSEDMRIKNPLTEEERVHARDLLNLVLYFAEEEDAGHTFEKRTSVDLGNLYSQGVESQTESDVSEDTPTIESDSLDSGSECIWAKRHAQHREEMSQDKPYREALRKKKIVPYFHPENGPLYQDQKPDIRRLSLDLPPLPKSLSVVAFPRDVPQETTPRPLNRMPSKSASFEAGSGRMLTKRPNNSKPQPAGESSPRSSSGHCKSVQVDVTGKPRRSKIRLPSSILSSKPFSIPNQQFLSVEEPVRRKCRTISLADPNLIVRGFQLLSSSVDFGTVKERMSSTITVLMRNVGVDTCRFHVKQPAPSTGLRILYNPGPVAAGLHVELKVQLFAKCAATAGEVEPKQSISQDIIISTETEILYLPVTATILPERLYNLWLKEHSKNGSKVHQLSSSLPAEQDGVQSSSLLNRHSASLGHN